MNAALVGYLKLLDFDTDVMITDALNESIIFRCRLLTLQPSSIGTTFSSDGLFMLEEQGRLLTDSIGLQSG